MARIKNNPRKVFPEYDRLLLNHPVYMSHKYNYNMPL